MNNRRRAFIHGFTRIEAVKIVFVPTIAHLTWLVVIDSPDDEAALVRLVSLRYAVEVLDALDGPPMTQHRLRRVLLANRGQLTVALRALAAYGAIRRHGRQESWDTPNDATTSYELTGTGRDVLDLLNHIGVWEDFYRRYLDRQTARDQ